MDFLHSMTVTEILSVFTAHHSKGAESRMVCRPSFGLCFCLEGRISFFHHQREYICDPGTAVFMPKGESYEIFSHIKGIFPLINFQCGDGFSHAEFVTLPIDGPSFYVSCLNRISKLLACTKTADRFRSLAVFYDLLARLLSDASLPGKATVLRPGIEYLENHYCDPQLTVLDLAVRSYISEVYFRRLFRENYGMTPKQYVKTLRINHAKELLKEPLLPVSTVAEQSGYKNIYHFCRDFKETVGCTPSVFRHSASDPLF